MVRYLKAILLRLDKQKNEMQNLQQLQRFWIRYWDEVKTQAEKHSVWPEQQQFRWALEEFRVSLFAQQLKTAYPVSAKRLEKLWDESH
jgi:ATP-dependent helicase HrpA